MLFRRSLGLSAAAFGRLGRGFSTASRRPPWAMIHRGVAVDEPAPRASLRLSEPPYASSLVVPAHLVRPPRDIDPPGDIIYAAFGGLVKAGSGDGLLLLTFFDLPCTAPVVPGVFGAGGIRHRVVTGLILDPEITRFVCNPLTGQLFRLPDIDGTTKTVQYSNVGILTQSGRPDHPPDKYAVAVLGVNQDRSFLMRRFLSQTGKWDKLVALPSPLALARPMYRCMGTLHEVVAFAGRLWWVDVTCGALSVDPFSDRPELRFTELPRGSVTDAERIGELTGCRRIGVSEGRLRYAEVSQEEPFLLTSFTLDDDGNCWTLEHRVALRRLWPHEDLCEKPQIAVLDPLNASLVHLAIGNQVFSLDMVTGTLLRRVLICGHNPTENDFQVRPCLLPPWLQSSKIPSAGDLNFKGKTLSDILVRADKDKKN